MRPYQFSYPEQERIYRRLDALVGRGAAAFYKDACHLMAMDSPLESTTHLVGHLLREVESSLRDVLEPIWEQPARKKGSNDEQHRNEILAALKVLEIDETSVTAAIWLKLAGKKGEDGLHKRAHRVDLAPPRAIDEDFQDFWRQIHTLLDTVLDQFEIRAVEIRIRLDELLAKSVPTEQDIKVLRLNMPNSAFALGYFFEHLESPAWLKPLYEAGFFNNPPGMETDAEAKTFRFPPWSQSRYLIKVAAYEPEIVLAIATQLLVSNRDNILIHEDLTEAALKMPPIFAAHWAEQAITWLRQQTHLHSLLANTLGELIGYLASEDQADTAIRLARELLTVLPEDSEDSSFIRRPIIRFDEYYYNEIIKEHLSILTEQQPDRILTLFCDLLDCYLNISYSTEEGLFSEDHSYSWGVFLDSISWEFYGINRLLARSIWDVTKQILEKDSNQVRSLLQKFQGYRWRIFDRIILNLLRCYPEKVPELIIERLTERNRLDWLGDDWFYYSHEHAFLLKEQFVNLPAHADNTNSPVQSGPDSPKSGAELALMAEGDMNELFTYLQEWQPTGRSREASRNGLAWELAEQVITPNPQLFVSQIDRFKELDSQFMVWLLRGLKKALDNAPNKQSTFLWESVISFCQWMLENLKNIRDCSTSDGYSEWSRICDAIVELIDTGLLAKGVSSIPLPLRRQVWQLLEPLTKDPQVTPGFTPFYEGSSMGSYSASGSTVRGKAMRAVVRYAFWLRQDADGNAEASENFNDMLEVQQVLEWHLNSRQDPSFAIRAVYGIWFPHILHLASGWTIQRIDQIFPEDQESQWLFEAAWEGYISNQTRANVFSVLRRKYIHAVRRLPTLSSSSREQLETATALSKHLLNLFWYTVIDLGEPDRLLEEFFAKAPTYPREEFMRQISWRLLYGDFEVSDELRQRLQKFLEWRIDQAKNSTTEVEQLSDLKYFSWLFSSGKLDDQWTMAKLVDVLQLLGTVNDCREFFNRLERLASTMPQDVVQCLFHLANGNQASQWFASYEHHHHRAILKTVLQSEDEVARREAKNLINRLVARNLGDFRELLS
jgi:hypothetical protein